MLYTSDLISLLSQSSSFLSNMIDTLEFSCSNEEKEVEKIESIRLLIKEINQTINEYNLVNAGNQLRY